MTRRSYTREFKAKAVRLVNDQGLSCAEAARDLGLHPSVLYRWVKGYGGDSHQAFPGHGQQGATQAEITVVTEKGNLVELLRCPVKTDMGDLSPTSAPRLGAHSEQVLTEFGFSQEEILRLKSEKVIHFG